MTNTESDLETLEQMKVSLRASFSGLMNDQGGLSEFLKKTEERAYVPFEWHQAFADTVHAYTDVLREQRQIRGISPSNDLS